MNTPDGAAASPTSDSSHDETTALAPAEMFALLNDQQRAVTAKLTGFVPTIMAAWGGAWLIGFTALFLIDGAAPAFSLPIGLAIGIFVACLAVAIGISIWLGVRSGRGVKSGSDFSGTVYGVTWSGGSLAIAAIGGALLQNGLSPELANLFYPSVFIFFVGIMYLAAGAIWRAVPSIIAGAWLLVIASVAPYIGYPWHYLFFALAGGLGFLLFAILGRNLLNGTSAYRSAGA